jgi:hypothetical protein
VALTDVERVVVTAENDLRAGPNRGGCAAYLAGGVRAMSVELSAPSDADVLRAALRAGSAVGLELAMDHPAGHELSLSLPALYPERVGEESEPGRLVRETTTLAAGTGPAGEDITYTVTLNL